MSATEAPGPRQMGVAATGANRLDMPPLRACQRAVDAVLLQPASARHVRKHIIPTVMKITEDHWLDPVTRIPLPGGASMPVRRFLVIHHTAGATGRSSIDYWKHLANGVCAHFVIERDGEIIQCRPCNTTCGHAGPSKWTHDGVNYNGLNKCSIGIELANGGSTFPSKFSDLAPKYARHKHGGPSVLWEVYPDAQLKACFELSRVLVARYKLDDVLGHEDIAPDRKTDPGPLFPMARLRAENGFTSPL